MGALDSIHLFVPIGVGSQKSQPILLGVLGVLGSLDKERLLACILVCGGYTQIGNRKKDAFAVGRTGGRLGVSVPCEIVTGE